MLSLHRKVLKLLRSSVDQRPSVLPSRANALSAFFPIVRGQPEGKGVQQPALLRIRTALHEQANVKEPNQCEAASGSGVHACSGPAREVGTGRP